MHSPDRLLPRRTGSHEASSRYTMEHRAESQPLEEMNSIYSSKSYKDHRQYSIPNDSAQAEFVPSSSQHHQHRKLKTRASLQQLSNVIRHFWIWEVLACLFSAMCLASIVGVLVNENGRQLDRWNLILLPNVVVSFIATLAKASMVLVISQVLSQLKWLHFLEPRTLEHIKTFDLASRGPWGAFILIFKTRRWLTSIVATLMLAALLVDPFIQLVFSFPIKAVEDEHQQAVFPRTQNYTATDWYLSNIGSASGIQVIVGMSISIGNAFNNAPLQYNYTCSSGNCTWPAINTLGVCGSCQDVASEVTVLNCDHAGVGTSLTNLSCSYSYSDDSWPVLSLQAMTYESFAQSDGSGYNLNTATLWNSSSSTTYIMTGNAGSKALLTNFWAIQSAVVNPNISTAFPIKATRCGIYFCEKTLDVSVTNGIANVITRNEEPLYLGKGWEDQSPSEHWIMDLYKGQDVNHTDRNHATPYHTNYQLVDTLGNQLAQSFTFASQYTSSSDESSGFTCMGNGCFYHAGTVFSTTKDFNITLNRLADFMTETIRTGENSTNVQGMTFVMKTFISVRWEWLGLPLALLLLTSVLLAVVAVQSHASNAPNWKDNPLALLLLQIDGVDARMPIEPTYLDTLAHRLHVKLSPDRPFTLNDATPDM